MKNASILLSFPDPCHTKVCFTVRTNKPSLSLPLKPLQNKKGKKNFGYPKKKQSFYLEKDCFFSGTPNIFGPPYIEVALEPQSLFPWKPDKDFWYQ